ncbi:hypothetical protein, partial [Streptomyces sparsus]
PAAQPPRTAPSPAVPDPHPAGARAAEDYAKDLRTMCQVVMNSPGALHTLHDFLSRSLPEPGGARALGCALHLAGCAESAQFWWQYAAGAGDHPAAYCLYLHHQAHGEDHQAHWWYDQADLTVDPMDEEDTETERSTALRVLRALHGDRVVSQTLDAVLAYVPAAVGFVDDDLDLPLPDEDFTERIEALIAHAATRCGGPPSRAARATRPLPARTPAEPGSDTITAANTVVHT